MTENFTLEDLFIKIIPGGVVVGVLYFVYGDKLDYKIVQGVDFLYTFLFFTFSFLTGEIIQTIAHELEFIINIFFKFNKPSEVFLYKNNPVLDNENIRLQIIQFLKSDEDNLDGFENTYNELKWFRMNKELQNKSQGYFWKIYTNVSNENEVKIFNRGYLLTRGLTIVSLMLIVIFSVEKNIFFILYSCILFLMFLWRTRGMARTLVFKTVLLNLKNK